MFSPASDEVLVNRALDGSQSGWEKLVRRHETMVYNYCLRMTRNRGDAMDLMQEVFLAVFRHLPSYRGEGHFRGWMLRIAVNKTMDFLRARQRSPQLCADESAERAIGEWEAPEGSNPAQALERDTENARVHRMLQLLPPEQRWVVELKFFQHLTLEQISRETGVPLSTVKSRFYASLQKLRENLEERHVM